MATGGRQARRVAAALVVLALVAGCTGKDRAQPPSSTDGVPAGPDGGVLRVGLAGDLLLDPVDASLASPSDQMVLDLLYDGVTRVDADGVVQPGLADQWRHNDSMTAWRFTLARGASFASGRAITSQDVVTSIERIVAGGDTSLVALSLESVHGFRSFVGGKSKHLAGLTAPSPRTVRVALDSPLSVLPALLASPAFGVVDPESLDAAAHGHLADLELSGSWSVHDADDSTLTLARRREFPGHLDGVELHSYDDDVAAYEAFADGDVDWATVPRALYGEAVDKYGDDHFAPFHAELFFGLNLASPSLGNGYLRLAIEAAIDRDAIVKAVYPDLADPLGTVIPAGVVGHDDKRCGVCGPDAKSAADLVAQTYPDGNVPTINIDYDESPAQEAMAKVIADDLDKAGIPTKLRARPLEEYKRFVVSGGQELFTFGWIGVYTSPDAYLAPLFVSDSNDNLTAFRSSEVDGLLSRARASDDVDKDAARWAAAETAAMSASVVVPIAQFRTQVVLNDRVLGWQHAVDGTVNWVNVSISG